MHAPPAFQITVQRFGIWRGACAVLWSAVAATQVAWSASGQGAVVGWCGLALTLACGLAAMSAAWRLRPVSLRWDGQAWHFGDAATRGEEPVRVRPVISLDLGNWLLVNLRPEHPAVPPLPRWLPLQRQGHEASWHGLRATLYGAKPAAVAF